MASFKDVPKTTVVSVRKEVPHSTYGSFLSASAMLLLEFIKENGVEPVGSGTLFC